MFEWQAECVSRDVRQGLGIGKRLNYRQLGETLVEA